MAGEFCGPPTHRRSKSSAGLPPPWRVGLSNASCCWSMCSCECTLVGTSGGPTMVLAADVRGAVRGRRPILQHPLVYTLRTPVYTPTPTARTRVASPRSDPKSRRRAPPLRIPVCSATQCRTVAKKMPTSTIPTARSRSTNPEPDPAHVVLGAGSCSGDSIVVGGGGFDGTWPALGHLDCLVEPPERAAGTPAKATVVAGGMPRTGGRRQAPLPGRRRRPTSAGCAARPGAATKPALSRPGARRGTTWSATTLPTSRSGLSRAACPESGGVSRIVPSERRSLSQRRRGTPGRPASPDDRARLRPCPPRCIPP